MSEQQFSAEWCQAASNEIERLALENDHLRAQLVRGVAHAQERVGLVEDVETMRGLLTTACDWWEHSRPSRWNYNSRPPVAWYDAARQATSPQIDEATAKRAQEDIKAGRVRPIQEVIDEFRGQACGGDEGGNDDE